MYKLSYMSLAALAIQACTVAQATSFSTPSFNIPSVTVTVGGAPSASSAAATPTPTTTTTPPSAASTAGVTSTGVATAPGTPNYGLADQLSVVADDKATRAKNWFSKEGQKIAAGAKKVGNAVVGGAEVVGGAAVGAAVATGHAVAKGALAAECKLDNLAESCRLSSAIAVQQLGTCHAHQKAAGHCFRNICKRLNTPVATQSPADAAYIVAVTPALSTPWVDDKGVARTYADAITSEKCKPPVVGAPATTAVAPVTTTVTTTVAAH
jgi:hypothetical protein